MIGALMLFRPDSSPQKASPAYSINNSFSKESDSSNKPKVEAIDAKEFHRLSAWLKESRALDKKCD